MIKSIAFIALFVTASVLSLGALAQNQTRGERTPTKAQCEQAADSGDFGIHLSQRHRFVVRCAAGLPQR
jgi:hypothetical protein